MDDISGSQNVVFAASVSPRNTLEMHVLGSYTLDLLKLQQWSPALCVLRSPSANSDEQYSLRTTALDFNYSNACPSVFPSATCCFSSFLSVIFLFEIKGKKTF